MARRFNVPPGWPPLPTTDWIPPADWSPDPAWPAPPAGWIFYTDDPAAGGRAAWVEPLLTVVAGYVQKTWAVYREAHCAWQAAFSEGGSIQSELCSACLTEITWDRIKELKLTLCEGQGLTGSCEASRRYDRPER